MLTQEQAEKVVGWAAATHLRESGGAAVAAPAPALAEGAGAAAGAGGGQARLALPAEALQCGLDILRAVQAESSSEKRTLANQWKCRWK